MEILSSKICIIGLGYVGLPLAAEFSKKFKVIGFDTNKSRVNELRNGFDKNGEQTLSSLGKIKFTSDHNVMKNCNVYIITVPTPVDKNNKPDLNPIISASELVGTCLSSGDTVIYESTVYPGCTEEVCVPILKEKSNLMYNKEFFCGYSPERINPGDKMHTITKIVKLTSGSNQKAAKFIKLLYDEIIEAGTYQVSTISAAEAAKVIENTQRDVNIALINELSIIFNKLSLDTQEILKAAGTKWNFHTFEPGLVGGHCIGVDPYYLTHKALEVGYHPEIILAGRRINDNMAVYIAEQTISKLAKKNISSVGAKIAILGLTFKENCSDLRNTKAKKIVEKLTDYNCQISINDTWADVDIVKKQFNIDPQNVWQINNQDALIITVAHKEYLNLDKKDFNHLLKPEGVLMDVKSIFPVGFFQESRILHWRL